MPIHSDTQTVTRWRSDPWVAHVRTLRPTLRDGCADLTPDEFLRLLAEQSREAMAMAAS